VQFVKITKKNRPKGKCKKQTHDHEFLGSVKLAAEPGEDLHNHRFAGVSSQEIPINGGENHVHELFTPTDFFEDHLHDIRVKTGPAIPVGGGKHVHFAQDVTSVNDDHFHEFVVATLIQSPLTPVTASSTKAGRKLF
jgi:hypothetical protein